MKDTDKEKVVEAIRLAEAKTSGEIRVHINQKMISNDVLADAKKLFTELKMHHTKKRTGVLIYVVLAEKKFAVVGDKGINEVVPINFWEEVVVGMKYYLSKNDILEAVLHAVEKAGEQLKIYFPIKEDDINELTNEISEG